MSTLEQNARAYIKALDAIADRYFRYNSKKMRAAFGTGLPAQMNHFDMRIIRFLVEEGPTTMNELADYIGLASSTMTGRVDRLVELGVVERERSQEDRRVVLVKVAKRGEDIESMRMEHGLRVVRAMLRTLDEEEVKQFVAFTKKMTARIDFEEAEEF